MVRRRREGPEPATTLERPSRPPAGLGLRARPSGLGTRLRAILGAGAAATEATWDEVEEALIAADVGGSATVELVEAARLRFSAAGGRSGDDARRALSTEIHDRLARTSGSRFELGDPPSIILVVGVNGTGKTTTVAKLAARLQAEGRTVALAAGDTFRAAAIEQLDVWSQRTGIPLVKGQYKAHPSAVCFDAYEAAVRNGVQFLICDTAGRLHTRHNLMEELKKIERTLGKKDPTAPHERLLVVDATTGSNALSQAREFQKALALSGLIVTKLDGSGKGGVVVSIQQELGISTRFIGTGEKLEDFAPFDRETFVEQML